MTVDNTVTDVGAAVALDARALVVARRELDARRVAEMYALFETYYADVSRRRFDADLADKSHAILLLSPQGRVVGFSTVRWYAFEIDGGIEHAVFSGDTIIDRPWWGSQRLAAEFCRLAGRFKARHPDRPLWWFLISKGHRTYRYLPAFAHRFFPSPDVPTPAPIRARLDRLARQRFGDAYDAARGVIAFAQPHGRLRERWHVDATASDAVSPMGAFFEQRNPGYARGDELVCLTELVASNLRRLARSAFVEGFERAPGDDVCRDAVGA